MGQKHRRARARQALRVAVGYIKAQNFSMACRLLKQAIEIKHNLWEAHIRLAEVHCEMGMYYEAITEADLVLQAVPQDDWRVFFRKGDALGSLRRFESAIPYLARAIELNPMHGKTYESLGQCCAMLGRYEEAITASIRAEELGIRSIGVYNVQAASSMALGLWWQAYAACVLCLELSPNDPYSLSNYGVSSLMLGSLKEASDALHRAAELDPDDAIIMASLGGFYMAERKYGMALSQFREASLLRPNDQRIHSDFLEATRLLASYN